MKKLFLTTLILLLGANFTLGSVLTDDYMDIASSYVQQGKYLQALNYINKALDIDSTDKKLSDMRTDLYKLLGRDDAIFEFNNSQIGENPLELAVLCYEQGKLREAKELLNRYLEQFPKSDFAYMLRAKINSQIDEMPSALRDIKSAQAISNNYEYELVEALILYNSGKFSQSRDILSKLADNIQIYNVYKYLGLCNFKLGDYRAAVESFDKAILLFDDDKTIMQTYNEAKRLSYGR